MTEGTPWRLILRFAIPVYAGMFLQQLYNTADTVIVGNFLGEAALSAVGCTACLVMLLLAAAIGLSQGAGVILSQLFGAGDQQELRRNASGSVVLVLFLGLVVMLLGICLSDPILRVVLGTPPQLAGMANLYFRVYCLGMVFQFGYNIAASMLRSVGDSRASLYFLIISSLANIALDLLFIAGFGWGVAGAAAATCLAQMASCAAAFLYMYRKHPIFRFHLRDYRWDPFVSANVLRIGTPMALQQGMIAIGYILIQSAINSYGQSIVAAYTVGKRIDYFMTMFGFSLSTTMATYVGQNIGAGKMERVLSGSRQAVLLSFTATLCFDLVVWLSAEKLVLLFGLSDEAAAYGVRYIRFAAMSILVLSTYYPLFGLFQGSGDGSWAALISTCALSVRVLTIYLLRPIPYFSYRIVWMHPLFGFLVAFVIAWNRYLSGRWKTKKVLRSV